MKEMGQRAAEILLALLRGEVAERKVKFQGTLVVRDSTAPAGNSQPQLS
jgi:DNA-binding LacI/PurR family transcriptional regulator